MILEKKNHKYRDFVTRICDNCGKKENKTFGSIEDARKNRKIANNKDYCKKCSYLFRNLVHPKMQFSYSWNGGRYLNENGYFRVYTGNLKYEYEHKILLERHIKRKIKSEEKVHHIDLVKTNNAVENLYLCKNKAEHWKCHQSMEKCAFYLLGSKIWYDYKTKKYVVVKLEPINFKDMISKDLKIKIEDIQKIKCFKSKRRENGGSYLMPTNRKKYKASIHGLIIEAILNRKLFYGETIHHVNGDTLDNSVNNLVVMTRSEHKVCHYSLQNCIAKLFSKGNVEFKNGEYYAVNKEQKCLKI